MVNGSKGRSQDQGRGARVVWIAIARLRGLRQGCAETWRSTSGDQFGGRGGHDAQPDPMPGASRHVVSGRPNPAQAPRAPWSCCTCATSWRNVAGTRRFPSCGPTARQHCQSTGLRKAQARRGRLLHDPGDHPEPLEIGKIDGNLNPADVLTKHLDGNKLKNLTPKVGIMDIRRCRLSVGGGACVYSARESVRHRPPNGR
jgi:hypothetical protein